MKLYLLFRLYKDTARMEEGSRTFKILTGKPARKRPLGRSRYRWDDNILIDLK